MTDAKDTGYPVLGNTEGLSYRSIILELQRRTVGRELAWPGLESDFTKFIESTDRDLERQKKDLVSFAGSGIDCATAAVSEMKMAVAKLRQSEPGLNGDTFEGAAAPLVYSALKDLPIQPLVDQGFWRYVALVQFSDVVIWRHPAESAKSGQPGGAPRNFGIGSSSDSYRCVPFRMFVRGFLSERCVNAGGRKIAGLGDVDKWASHVLGQKYACNPLLVDVQFSSFDEMANHGAKDPVKYLRKLPKRLAEIRSNVVLDMLDLEESRAIVTGCMATIRKAPTQSD